MRFAIRKICSPALADWETDLDTSHLSAPSVELQRTLYIRMTKESIIRNIKETANEIR